MVHFRIGSGARYRSIGRYRFAARRALRWDPPCGSADALSVLAFRSLTGPVAVSALLALWSVAGSRSGCAIASKYLKLVLHEVRLPFVFLRVKQAQNGFHSF